MNTTLIINAVISIVLVIVGGILWLVNRKNETRKKAATAGTICIAVGLMNLLVQLIRMFD